MTAFLKSLLSLMHPHGLVWLLLTLWLVRVAWSRQLRSAVLPAVAWGVLTLVTCTPFSSWLLAGMEMRHPPVQLADLPQADAIVCLGGGAEPSVIEPTGLHLKRGSGRITTALMLATHQRAPLLVLGGGGYPHAGTVLSEADALARHLTEHRHISTPVISLGICADTHDEAVKVAALASQHRIQHLLLVTSASHMQRAVATFEKAGLRSTPVPCDYQSSLHRVGPVRWLHLPHPGGFETFATWFHEVIGSWLYRWRGWI